MPLKTCTGCGTKCAPRLRKCGKCGTVFAFKVKKKSQASSRVENWKELQSGDNIRVSGGPVWVDKEMVETSMGYSGIFLVVGLDQNGILARGLDRSSGYCHIWMGEEKLSDAGIIKRPHRVSKLKRAV
jgi:hypothetical protein